MPLRSTFVFPVPQHPAKDEQSGEPRLPPPPEAWLAAWLAWLTAGVASGSMATASGSMATASRTLDMPRSIKYTRSTSSEATANGANGANGSVASGALAVGAMVRWQSAPILTEVLGSAPVGIESSQTWTDAPVVTEGQTLDWLLPCHSDSDEGNSKNAVLDEDSIDTHSNPATGSSSARVTPVLRGTTLRERDKDKDSSNNTSFVRESKEAAFKSVRERDRDSNVGAGVVGTSPRIDKKRSPHSQERVLTAREDKKRGGISSEPQSARSSLGVVEIHSPRHVEPLSTRAAGLLERSELVRSFSARSTLQTRDSREREREQTSSSTLPTRDSRERVRRRGPVPIDKALTARNSEVASSLPKQHIVQRARSHSAPPAHVASPGEHVAGWHRPPATATQHSNPSSGRGSVTHFIFKDNYNKRRGSRSSSTGSKCSPTDPSAGDGHQKKGAGGGGGPEYPSPVLEYREREKREALAVTPPFSTRKQSVTETKLVTTLDSRMQGFTEVLLDSFVEFIRQRLPPEDFNRLQQPIHASLPAKTYLNQLTEKCRSDVGCLIELKENDLCPPFSERDAGCILRLLAGRVHKKSVYIETSNTPPAQGVLSAFASRTPSRHISSMLTSSPRSTIAAPAAAPSPASPHMRYSTDKVGHSFSLFLRSKACLSIFSAFAQEEYAAENLFFWHHMQQYRQLLGIKTASAKAAVRRREQQLLALYIQAGAMHMLNVSGQLREDLLANPHDRSLWLRAEDEVLQMLLGGTYVRMTAKLSETIHRSWAEVKAKFTLQEVGDLFYKLLFEAYPEVQPLFKTDKIKTQAKMLADMLDAAVSILQNLESLCKVLWDLGQRHKNYQVQVAHYAAVGECLIATLAAALGPSFDEPVRQAWTMVYELVSTVMILAMEPRTEQDLLITVPVNNKFVEAEAVKHLQIALASRPDKLPPLRRPCCAIS
eukprot:g42896.t1